MCGPFALPSRGRASHTAAWHSGKLMTYELLGAAAGAFGAVFPGPTWVVGVTSTDRESKRGVLVTHHVQDAR
ncbi:MAG: hypothetical protein ACKVG4_11285 [Longimicrobiales bacterium]|jgi:sulfite exporter TauE/SafE